MKKDKSINCSHYTEECEGEISCEGCFFVENIELTPPVEVDKAHTDTFTQE